MSRQPSGSAPDWYTAPAYPTDAFMGAAWYYARYRVPYPPALLDDLRQRAAITGTGRLFDLACGPGRVALPLAPFFREVWAVDQEPEMIEVGQAEAARRGVTNVRWLVGRAEEVEAPAGAFELITIGEAFHRLNQWRIAERALDWLVPGGCLATLGCDIVFAGAEPWQALAAAVLRRWRGAVPDFGPRPTGQPDKGLGRQEALLRAAGFAGIASYQFAIPYVWTLDTIIGNLYSTSVASQHALGDRADAFAADLRQTLLAHDARGEYPATLSFGYTLARRPVVIASGRDLP
ncbi:MAG: class I SAM-dependent methyltransferase [Thermomicrobiales bacterium]